MTSTTRRDFLAHAGAVSTTGLLTGTGLAGCATRDTLPLDSAQQLELTATQVLAAYKEGRLSATDYVSTLIARARQTADLNALIHLDVVGALAAARRCDADRAAGKALGILAGLPIVVKDNIHTKWMKTTGGTPSLQDFQPSANAPSLQKLLDAGAIVLGKANLHEWAFGITTTNFTLGMDPDTGEARRPCRNPYDTARIPGGSSGGTAVAIAARMAPAGLGSDTGGSTRVPAAFCGIAGFRPSVGNGPGHGRRYVDENAVVPICPTRDTVGPMGRTVADLALLDAVITGGPVPVARPLRGLRIGLPASFWRDLEDSVRTVAETARQQLAEAGVVFVEADLEGITALNDAISFPMALHEAGLAIPAYLAANEAPVRTLQDVAARLASPDVRAAFRIVIEDPFAADYAEVMTRRRPALQALYRDYFATHGVEAVMFPTVVVPPPPLDVVNGSGRLDYSSAGVVRAGQETFTLCVRNADPCTSAGLPSLSVPAGLTPDGLPVGMQFDGPQGSDTALLALGMGIEGLWGSVAAPT